MNHQFCHAMAILLLALIAASPACSNKADTGPAQKRQAGQAVEVRFASVQTMNVERSIPFEGTLLALEEARISSEVSGFAETVRADLGDLVQPGQVLIEINPREFQLNVERAEASLRQTEAQLGNAADPDGSDETRTLVRQAKANLDDAATNLAQAEALRKQGLISQQELNTAQTKYKVMEALYQGSQEAIQGLKATLAERKAALELARKTLADTKIRASIGGMIKERLVSKGDYTRENTPVMTIVRMDPLRLRLALAEKYAGQVRERMPVRFGIEAYPDENFVGEITNLSPSVDPQTRTFTVEATVSNPALKLKPGFFVKGWVITDPSSTTLGVPQEAVISFAGNRKVFILEGDKVRESLVQTGVAKDGLVEILSGVTADNRVAVTAQSRLAEGVQVREAHGEPESPQTRNVPAGK